MSSWQPDELTTIGNAEELDISTLRPDGTARPFVPVWVVAVAGEIYVRSYRGTAGAWYRNAARDGNGRIRVGGQERDITFEPPPTTTNHTDIDDAYHAKYGRYGDRYLQPMLGDAAKAATLR